MRVRAPQFNPMNPDADRLRPTFETALMAHTAPAEAAVIAIRDEKWSERPLAVVLCGNDFRIEHRRAGVALMSSAAPALGPSSHEHSRAPSVIP
jgi:hypothetical protein